MNYKSSYLFYCSFLKTGGTKVRSNRYVVALAGVIFHLMIGSVYAWSVYAKPFASQTSWSESAISFALSLAIFFLGMSAAFMGRLVEKFGPTVTGTISAL